jgi:Flp pilus assembly protein TadD
MYNLAVLYRRRGEDARAEEWLFRALAAGAPDPDGVVLAWAVEDVRQKKTAEAQRVLARGVTAFPDSEEIRRAYALDLFTHKDCAGADRQLAPFEPATKSTDTLNALGLIRACLGRREEATALFRKSLALNPAQDTVVRSLAVLEGGAGAKAEKAP